MTVSYSFMTSLPSYYNADENGAWAVNDGQANNFSSFSMQQSQAAIQALNLWQEVSGLTFVEDKSGNGQIRFGNAFNTIKATGWAQQPGDNRGGDVWLDKGDSRTDNPTQETYGFQTLIHEIGHALGLKHPFKDIDDTNDSPILTGAENSYQYTNMAYDYHPDMPNVEPRNPLLYDIAAIQYLYGANMSTRTGNDTYTWGVKSDGSSEFFGSDENFISAIWDAGGIDTIDASKQTLNSVIDLQPGHFSSIGNGTDNLALAFAVDKAGKSIDYNSLDKPDKIINLIENATSGSGDDQIKGNLANNVLNGGDGNDTLYGKQGDDTLDGGLGVDSAFGGEGNDIYYVDSFNDAVTENSSEGNDTVNSFITYALSDNIENLTLIGNRALNGIGNSLDNLIFGNNSNNNLSGADGNDTLYGGDDNDKLIGGTSADTLDGGNGNDTASYFNSTGGVTVNLSTGITTGGDASGDVLKSIEYLEGSEFGDILISDSQNNYLWGMGGDDTLIAGVGNDIIDGGFGNDSMLGGKDNDTYYLGGQFSTVSTMFHSYLDLIPSTQSSIECVGCNLIFELIRVGE
ncbi:hypothetical protein NIES267_09420 [Calothrix parasitica NIES-267]|uniref:Peptidase metallopeptidase domain-containing protein n=1 Tax=Calothrix parasitica NIES-267 TaxID=1973488 RepID=A0A1Z4LJT1_9CYAN|nr:hypothetical protein NIES267_09420 [Calothrix parasitica NIES-267]